MANIVEIGGFESYWISSDQFEVSFKENHFVSKDNKLYATLKEKYYGAFEEFKAFFSHLQHFPEFPYVDEGIETCIVNIFKQSVEQAPAEGGNGYVGQGTLQGLPYQNDFLKNLILNICEPLKFYGNQLHVGVKFHRREIEKGNETELKGLKPHKDYDSDIIVMMKIEQKNILGGRNRITNDSQTVLIEDSIAVPGSFIYVDNKQLFHELTPMSLADPSESGNRDVMILEIKKA